MHGCGGVGEIDGAAVRTLSRTVIAVLRSVVVVSGWRLVLGLRVIADRRGPITIAVIVIAAMVTEGGWRRMRGCGGVGEISGAVIRTPCRTTVVFFRSVVVVNRWRLVLGFRIITDRRGLVTIAVIVIAAVATDVLGSFARFVIVEAVTTVVVVASVVLGLSVRPVVVVVVVVVLVVVIVGFIIATVAGVAVVMRVVLISVVISPVRSAISAVLGSVAVIVVVCDGFGIAVVVSGVVFGRTVAFIGNGADTRVGGTDEIGSGRGGGGGLAGIGRGEAGRA